MSEETTLEEFAVDDKDTSEWEESRLKELLSEMVTGGRPTGGGLNEGEYISIGGTQVDSEGYLDLHDLVYIPEDYFEQVEETQLQKHDILVVKDGANTGDVAIAWKDNNRVVTNEHLFTLRAGPNINPPYLFYFLLSHRGWKQIHGTITGSAQEGINRGFAGKVSIEYPSLEEQRKIATVLYTVDQAIQKTEEIIEQKERIRTGLMQDIFTGVDTDSTKSVRLSAVDTEIPEHWEVKTVGEIATQITDGAHLTPDRSEDGYLLLSARNVKNGYLDLSDVDYVPEGEYERLIEKCNPQPGDILISCSGTVGRVCEVPEGLEFALVRSAALVKFDNSLLSSYAEKVLQSVGVQKQIKGYQTQSAQPNLFQGQIASLEIPIPPIEEQRDIAKKLDDVSDSINSDQRYQSQLKRLKRGLMQDLLSGTVQTIDTDIEIPDEIAQHG